jgi:hypothetical protein
MLRRYILLFLLLKITASYSQTTDSIFIRTDTTSGITKTIHKETSGTGGGLFGEAPHLTKVALIKYDKEGKLIYQSHTELVREGCIGGYSSYDFTIYDNNNGTYKTAYKRRYSINIIVRSYGKNGKLISKDKIVIEKFPFVDWADKDGW